MKQEKVWDRIFRKPEPVIHLEEWLQEPNSQHYVYLPNLLLEPVETCEHELDNCNYTSIMLEAYQSCCEATLKDPIITFPSGRKAKLLSLRPSVGLQPAKPGERASGLANTCVDFDDIELKDPLLRALSDLHVRKNTVFTGIVLKRVEAILIGESWFQTNQEILTKLYNRVLGLGYPTALVVNTLKTLSEAPVGLYRNRAHILRTFKESGLSDSQDLRKVDDVLQEIFDAEEQ